MVEFSIRGLADKTGLSVQNVRTALKVLEREGMVTQHLTHNLTQQKSAVTVCEYGSYSGVESGSQHSNQHSNQHPLQKGFPRTPPCLLDNINSACAKERFVDEVNTCYAKQEQALMSLGMRPNELPKFLEMAKDIMTEWKLTGTDDWTWRHLINHARIKLRNDGTQQANNSGNTADTSPDAFAQYYARKEMELRANNGTGRVS